MKKVTVVALFSMFILSVPAGSVALCPDGTYVAGDTCTLCPDGSYVGGKRCKLNPDGSYTGDG
jgi:hypothetical protein